MENLPVDINVVNNDTDVSWADRGTLTVGPDTDVNTIIPTTGTVTFSGGPVVHYDPGDKYDWLALGQEATDSFTYRLYDDDDTTVGTLGVVHVRIIGQREAYTVSFSASGVMEEEGQVGGNLTITLNPPAKADGVSVDWSLVDPYAKLGFYDSKAATSGDIVVPSGTVIFNKGQSTKTGLIKPVDDTTVEPDENAYFWMPESSVTTNAYTLDAGTFAQMIILDDEWRWVQQTASGGVAQATVAIADSGNLFPDDWTRSLNWSLDTNYVILDASSSYVANPSGNQWSSHATGFISYVLNSQTGQILPSTQSNVAIDNDGPTTAYAGYRDEVIEDDTGTEHTVSFKIDLGAACHGTLQLQASDGIVTYSKQQEYGKEVIRMYQIVMRAKRGNG